MRFSLAASVVIGLCALTDSDRLFASVTIYGAPGYDFSTLTGYYLEYPANIIYVTGSTITNHGATVTPLRYYESGSSQYHTSAMWRAEESPVFLGLPEPVTGGTPLVKQLNESRQSIGSDSADDHPLTWSPTGTQSSLPEVGPTEHTVEGINSSGVMAGSGGTLQHNVALRWDSPSSVAVLSTPSGWNEFSHTFAHAISNTGLISGSVFLDGVGQAVIWHPNGESTVLGNVTDTGRTLRSSSADLVNNAGVTAGSGFDSSDESQIGLIWSATGDARELQPFPGADSTLATRVMDLSNANVAVGYTRVSLDGHETYRAIRWQSDGSAQALDLLEIGDDERTTLAVQINDFGFAAGSQDEGTGLGLGGRSVLWTPNGNAIDLNDLIPEDSPWLGFYAAMGITNTGWVKGFGAYPRNGVDTSNGSIRREWTMLLPFAGTYGLGDANFDEAINFSDLLIVAQNYGLETSGSVDMGDLNLDGTVDFSDLLTVAQNYESDFSLLPTNASSNFLTDWNIARTMVPEPSTLTSILIVGLMLKRHRA